MFLLADVNFIISAIRTVINLSNLLYSEFSSIGSINIYNTINGKSVWKINPCDDVDLTIATQKEGGNNMTNIHSIIHEALQDASPHYFMMRSGIESILGTKEVFFICGRTKIGSALYCACSLLPRKR